MNVDGTKRKPSCSCTPNLLDSATPKVTDADEAVELANSSAFGLGGAVFSSDEKLAMEVADRLDVGMVWINTAELGGPELPFGGTKRSGVGRELGPLGIDEFVNKKLIHTPPAAQ